MRIRQYSPYLCAKKKKNELKCWLISVPKLKKKKSNALAKNRKKYLEIYKISQKNYIVL